MNSAGLGWAGPGWAEHSEMENTEGRSQQRCIALLLYLPSTLRSAETSENAAFESYRESVRVLVRTTL